MKVWWLAPLMLSVASGFSPITPKPNQVFNRTAVDTNENPPGLGSSFSWFDIP